MKAFMKSILTSILAVIFVTIPVYSRDFEPENGQEKERAAVGKRGNMSDRESGRDEPMRRKGRGEMGGGEDRGLGFMERLLKNPRVAKELNLSEEQTQQLKEQAEEIKTHLKELHTKLKATGREQVKLMTEGNEFNEEALMAKIEETGAIRTEIAKQRIRQLISIRKILTDEQMQKLKNMHERIRSRHRENREQMQGRRRGGREEEDNDGRRKDRDDDESRTRRRPGKDRPFRDRAEDEGPEREDW